MPRCPTRSSHWTDPGRSTSTIRRPPRWRGSNVRWPRPPPLQSPRCRSTASSASSGSIAPAMTRLAHVRRIAAGVEGPRGVDVERARPSPGSRPRGGRTASSARTPRARKRSSASRPGSARAWRMSFRRSDLIRSNSRASSRGVADHLGQQRQPVVELAAERGEAGARAVPRRLAADLDAEPLGRLGEGGRVEALGAGHEHLRGQRRRCRPAPRPRRRRRHRSGGGR